VSWTKLLANKEAQRHKTSKKELDNMRALIARDLADAGLAGLSADRAVGLPTSGWPTIHPEQP
jgi:N-acyl-D-aspartate/D-glutamate deacylase